MGFLIHASRDVFVFNPSNLHYILSNFIIENQPYL